MTRMWRGACAELKAAEANPLFIAVTHHCGRNGIFFDLDDETGREASIFKVSTPGGRCGTYFRNEIGQLRGHDPIDTVFRIAQQYAPLDGPLIRQAAEHLIQRAEKLTYEIHRVLNLENAVDDLLEMIASVRS